MSVYIPATNNTSGEAASKSWAQSRFATKTALLNTDSNVTNNTSAINSLNSSRSDLVSRVTTTKVNIGPTAKTNQGLSTIAIGEQAGTTNQGANSIAIGTGAGSSSQLSAAIAIGNGAGASSQASDSIALGNGAGGSSLGATTIAIGKNAATSNAAATSNNIILNATGLALNTAVSNATYIKPIRTDTSKTSALCYDTTSGEVVADNTIKSDITTINNNLNTLSTVTTSNNNSINTLNNTTIPNLQSSVSTNTSNITSLQSSVSSNTSSITSLQSSVSSNTSNITSLQSTTTSLTNRVADTIVKVGINSGIAALSNSVSIGNTAGTSAGANSISIGQASRSWGDNSICIGQNAKSSVGNNSICLNATGSDLITTSNGLYVAPVRNVNDNQTNILTYNTTSKEITYNNNTIEVASLIVNKDDNDGSNVPRQFFIKGATDANKKLYIGYHSTNNYAHLLAIQEGSTYRPIILNGLGNGGVGINTLTPLTSSYQLDVNGDARKTGSSSWATTSDSRLKNNIEDADVDICYNVVKNLKLKRFSWDAKYYPDMKDKRISGFIAQDVEQVFPKAVTKHSETFTVSGTGPDPLHPDREDTRVYETVEDLRTVDVDQIYRTMYGAVQKLMEKVEALQSQVDLLKSAQ